MTPITHIRAVHLRLVTLLRLRARALLGQRLLGNLRARAHARVRQTVAFPIKKPTHEAPKTLQ
jgi:hypothetical protein